LSVLNISNDISTRKVPYFLFYFYVYI
jgi:hypothetical protein